jgi:hypothetical protein
MLNYLNASVLTYSKMVIGSALKRNWLNIHSIDFIIYFNNSINLKMTIFEKCKLFDILIGSFINGAEVLGHN